MSIFIRNGFSFELTSRTLLIAMKNILLTFCIAYGLVSLPAFAELSRDELLTEITEAQQINYIGENYGVTLADQFRSLAISKGMEIDEDFYSIIQQSISEVIYEELVYSGELKALVESQFESFSNAELAELVTFYKSSIGRKLKNVEFEFETELVQKWADLENGLAVKLDEKVSNALSAAGFDPDQINSQLFQKSKDAPIGPSKEKLERLSAKICSDQRENKKRTPVHRGAPSYPAIARLYSIEGWVEVSFGIDKEGRTYDSQVKRASNGSIFNKSALNAVNNYYYCASSENEIERTAVRIHFRMEDSEKKSFRGADKKSSESNLNSEFFARPTVQKSFTKYKNKKSRKAMAIAFDGDYWALGWASGHKNQTSANQAALKKCNFQRQKGRVDAECRLLLEGHSLTDTSDTSPALENMVSSLNEHNYQPLSAYETTVAQYKNYLSTKALAMVQRLPNDYYLYSARNFSSQAEANQFALENCNENKPERFTEGCALTLIGDFEANKVPSLVGFEGIWEGQLLSKFTGSDRTNVESVRNIKLDNCAGYPQIYLGLSNEDNDKEQNYQLIKRLFNVEQKENNAVLSNIEDGGDWVETQTWTLIQIGSETATMQQNRMVENTQLSLSDDGQEFGEIGRAKLKRTNKECP